MLLGSPVAAYVEKALGVAGLVVITYMLISSVVSLFRSSSTRAIESVTSLDSTEPREVEDMSVVSDTGDQARSGSKAKSALLEIVETIVMTVLIFAAVRLMVQNFRIEGNSMEPNLHNGQYLIIEKVSYRFSNPKRGDVVVFHYPSNPKRDFIKRIVGLPGEIVEVRRNQVFINGKPLVEPYKPLQGSYNWGPAVVGDDEYFVLGDNRNNSSDSHSWGMLPRSLIVGKAWFCYWPLTEWGFVSHYDFPDETGQKTASSPVMARLA